MIDVAQRIIINTLQNVAKAGFDEKFTSGYSPVSKIICCYQMFVRIHTASANVIYLRLCLQNWIRYEAIIDLSRNFFSLNQF